MNRIVRHIALPLISIGLLGCESMPWNKDDKKSDDKGVTAVAKVRPSAAAATQPSWGKGTGTVTFTQKAPNKVRVQADISGLAPGEHGFHIHEKGDLSAPDLSSAGAHFNPTGHKHAGPKDDIRHAGDLGNITADASGKAKLDITVSGIAVGGGGPDDIVGKAVILHDKADDLKTNPSGNSGGRVAGGVIEKK